MLIDGPITTQTIDSSGEILDLKGLDISDFLDGKATANFEHNNDNADDVLGWFIYAKKIFGEQDCENERQRMFWEKVKTPFLYGVLELLDDTNHPGAIAVAAMLRYFKKKNEPVRIGMSIEGSTLERDGHILKRTVGRKVAITLRPCNKQCMLDVLPPERSDELFKKMESDHIQSFEIDSPILEKSEYLDKGAIRRLYGKFNPEKELSDEDKKNIYDWNKGTIDGDTNYSNVDQRSKLPDLFGQAKLRTFNKLSNKTDSRKNPKTGEREFLLHRQLSENEYNKFVNNYIYLNDKSHSSWTPAEKILQVGIHPKSQFEPDSYKKYNHIISAWIPESEIKTFLPQYGGLINKKPDWSTKREQEVIVKPGKSFKIHKIFKDSEENPLEWIWKKIYEAKSNKPFGKSEPNLIDEIKKDLLNLRKTLTAGMGNAAPSGLVGGSALSVEDKQNKKNINVLKSVIRDFQGRTKEDFKKAVKEALPDLSDKYVDHFVDLAEDLSLKKFNKRLY